MLYKYETGKYSFASLELMLLEDVFEFKFVSKRKNPQNVSAVKSAGRVEWFPRGLLAMVPATCH